MKKPQPLVGLGLLRGVADRGACGALHQLTCPKEAATVTHQYFVGVDFHIDAGSVGVNKFVHGSRARRIVDHFEAPKLLKA